MAFCGGQTQGSFLPGKYLEAGLRGHSRQFSQVVVPVHTRTSKLHRSRNGLLGQQTLQQSLVCRMFIAGCPWDQLLWKGAVGSKIGPRESEMELQCRASNNLGSGVLEMAPQNYPELGKWASPLCPPSVTVTLDERRLRQSQGDWRWRLSALLGTRGRNRLVERRSRQRLTVSACCTRPQAYLALSVCSSGHSGGRAVVCHCGVYFAFL